VDHLSSLKLQLNFLFISCLEFKSKTTYEFLLLAGSINVVLFGACHHHFCLVNENFNTCIVIVSLRDGPLLMFLKKMNIVKLYVSVL